MADGHCTGEFKVNGVRFAWEVKRYAGMRNADSNYRGLVARVRLAKGVFRELVIEFHPSSYPGQVAASGSHLEARLIEFTQEAIASGWRPESRGKPFRLEVTN